MRGQGTAREQHLAQSLSGRQSGSGRLGISSVLFRPMTLICLVLIGLFSFGALIVLGGFAKDFRKTEPGQATPRSVSAVGYKSLTHYLDRLGYDVEETRGKRESYERNNRLVIYTPSRPSGRVKRKLESEGEHVSLIVLPKWSVRQMAPKAGEESQSGWARKTSKEGLVNTGYYKQTLEETPVIRREDTPTLGADLVFKTQTKHPIAQSYQPDFKSLQYFDLDTRWLDYSAELRKIAEAEREEFRRKLAEEKGETYEPKKKEKKDKAKDKASNETAKKEDKKDPEPLPNHDVILEIDGRAVLIRLEETQTYVLSEPDLVNTTAFKTQSGAHLSSVIIDEVIQSAGIDSLSVDFDVSLHGIESNQNVIKLMVTPPFLAATLCLLAAGGLVAWQGFNRFGDPARERPDYAQGPVSLANTAAEFMEVANRTHRTGEDYAALIRRQVAAKLGYKDRTLGHIDTLLDTREKRLGIQPSYEDLKTAISNTDQQSYKQYAQALTAWRNAMTETPLTADPSD